MTWSVVLPEIAVIMPTLGTPERGPLLRRALHSVLTQDGVETVPIVVFNGPRRDPALVQEVKGDAQGANTGARTSRLASGAARWAEARI